MNEQCKSCGEFIAEEVMVEDEKGDLYCPRCWENIDHEDPNESANKIWSER